MKKARYIIPVILLLFSLFLSLTACETPGVQKEYETRSAAISYSYFNTVSLLSSYGDTSEEEFESYVKISDETLGYYHKLFDIYYEYSGINNIRTINKNAGKNPVVVDEELVVFLEYCKQLYTITQEKTNIMLGSVLKIWHDSRTLASENDGVLDESFLPDAATLTEAAKHTSMDSLIIDREAKTVYISDPEASIDVGAIAKGYAAKKLADKLKVLGADSLVLNAGGNIITIGKKPDGSKWVTGITNPDKKAENFVICKVQIGETSLVTSGDYERYFICGDKKYHHIIDPTTLFPADYFSSVSIFTADSALADALSTALFSMSYEDGFALVNEIGGVEVIWITKTGEIKNTEGITFYNK